MNTSINSLYIAAILLAGCSGKNEMTNLPKPPQQFCDAAAKYEDSITVATAVGCLEIAKLQLLESQMEEDEE